MWGFISEQSAIGIMLMTKRIRCPGLKRTGSATSCMKLPTTWLSKGFSKMKAYS